LNPCYYFIDGSYYDYTQLNQGNNVYTAVSTFPAPLYQIEYNLCSTMQNTDATCNGDYYAALESATNPLAGC